MPFVYMLIGGMIVYVLIRILDAVKPPPPLKPTVINAKECVKGSSEWKYISPDGLYQPPLDWYFEYLIEHPDPSTGEVYLLQKTKIGDKANVVDAIIAFTEEHPKQWFFITKVELITEIATS